jgi:hypothetical protein
VGKGDVRRREMTVRVSFADCHTGVGKGFFFNFLEQNFFADCLYWHVAKVFLNFFRT